MSAGDWKTMASPCAFNAAAAGTGDFVVTTAADASHDVPQNLSAIDGKSYRYSAESTDGTQTETGNGTWHAATLTLSRTTVAQSTDGMAMKCNFLTPPIVVMFASAPATLDPKQPPHSGLVEVDVYTSSQTITIPPLASRAIVYLWGGSGGSGGVIMTGLVVGDPVAVVSGSTGAGGYLEKYLSGLTPGNTLIFTAGAAGAAGAATPTAGGNGGASILASGTQNIPTLTANGSNGSASLSSTGIDLGTPTANGTTSGGDFSPNLPAGQAGSIDYNWDSTNTANFVVAAAAGQPGISPVSMGASGAALVTTTRNAAQAGNPGNPGGMIIEWYT